MRSSRTNIKICVLLALILITSLFVQKVSAEYDQQYILAYSNPHQGTSLSVQVQAISQPEHGGTGPAYLLNGLTDKYIWYQVGIAKDWGESNSGWVMTWEIFNKGDSDGGIVLVPLSGQINEGDPVILSIKLTDVVTVDIYDVKNGVHPKDGPVALNTFGSTQFIGWQNAPVSPYGTFTGPMTEQYFSTRDQGTNPNPETYTPTSSSAAQPAWLRISDFCSVNNIKCGSYYNKDSDSPVTPPPTNILTTHGICEAYRGDGSFTTGYSPCAAGLSLSVQNSKPAYGQTDTITGSLNGGSPNNDQLGLSIANAPNTAAYYFSTQGLSPLTYVICANPSYCLNPGNYVITLNDITNPSIQAISSNIVVTPNVLLTIQANPISTNQPDLITATVQPSTYTVTIQINGQQIASGTGTATYTYCATNCNPGSYKVTAAVDATYSVSQTLTVQSSSSGGSGGGGGSGGYFSGLCNGSSSLNGIIPLNNVLSGKSGGVGNILAIALLITLTMLLVVSIIYMISYVLNLDLLKNLAKAEVGEVVITAIIVFVFLGSFVAISGATNQNYFHIAGSGFGRSTFVSDCTYLSDSSIGLIAPFFGINILRFFLTAAASAQINILPKGFGFSISPLTGIGIFDQVLSILDEMTGALILLNLGTLMILGIIYALFPLFLYAGIVLRTLPWTRAAGGAFLGLFAGFYIAFPLLLHVMLAGYIPNAVALAQGSNFGGYVVVVNPFVQGFFSLNSGPGILTYAYNYFSNLFVFGQQYGLINGFIYAVIEPGAFTFLAIVVAFIISFDIAEATGDILGAPSLRTSGMLNRLI